MYFEAVFSLHSVLFEVSFSVEGNLKEFWLSDAVWFSSLESSHWLSSLSCCLQVALEMATNIINRKTVILKGTNEILSWIFPPILAEYFAILNNLLICNC